MLSDLEIARRASLRPIVDLAAELGLAQEQLEPYGWYKAKVHLDAMEQLPRKAGSHYVAVTAITPTPLGEGKTTTTIGLSQALGSQLGKQAIACIRQPSLGPTFGIKGGAAGGGYSQIVPMTDFNLHLTGDMHAVGAAHNLMAAAIDSRMIHEMRLDDRALARSGLKRLDIAAESITWKRVVDIEDAAARHIVTGLGGLRNGVLRETGFDITAASEIMAILSLAISLPDLRQRLGRIVFGSDKAGNPLTAEDLDVAGAMAVLTKDALMPNLMQTLEQTPAFVHTGPFANIAPGNSSCIADLLAMRLADYVVTESGFGADCGLEKLFDIKCRVSGLEPSCVVMVATVRALKMHGGLGRIRPGRPLPEDLTEENLPALRRGCANLVANLEIVRRFGLPVVVAINPFDDDTDAEIELIRQIALDNGAYDAVCSEHWAKGGAGAADLARVVVAACQQPSDFHHLYPLDMPIKGKIETVARQVYGADGVDYERAAEKAIERYTELGYGSLPICNAKTQLSLSHDPHLKGAPTGWRLPVRDVGLSAGAGFLTPMCGDIRTMPGLPRRPNFMDVDLTADGEVKGLF